MYKRTISLYFITLLSIGIILFLPLYLNDPLQVFHKDPNNKNRYSNQMRYQAAGFINNFKHDSIILGTSMLANTSTQEAEKYLNGKFINISIYGGDYYERSILLKHALSQQALKQVFYSLDDSYLLQSKANASYFEYLYDDNLINDFKIYLNKKYILKCALGFSKNEKCLGKEQDTLRPNAWYQELQYQRHFGGINNLLSNQDHEEARQEYKKIALTAKKIESGQSCSLLGLENQTKKAYEYIDQNLLSIVKKHKNTKFIFIFPPYSRLVYAQWAQYDRKSYKVHTAILKYLSQADEKNKNLEVYAWGDHDFLDDIANYKDTHHYHHSINTWMLQAINENKGRLSASNINQYLNNIDRKNKDYNLSEIGRQIDAFYQTN